MTLPAASSTAKLILTNALRLLVNDDYKYFDVINVINGFVSAGCTV